MSVRAIMVVHIYGRRVNMDSVHAFAKKHGLLVIEDLAEAHGVKPHPDTHAVCHSFYKNKIVAGEEGGAVWFRDPAHASHARQLRSLGFTDAHDFDHVPRGHNYRMSDAHARLILESMRKYNSKRGIEFADGTQIVWSESVDPIEMKGSSVGGIVRRWADVGNNERRREIESWYDEFCPAEWRMPPRDAVWVYDVRVPGMTRQRQRKVVKALNAEGIAARMSFLPMHWQVEYRGCRFVDAFPPPTNSKSFEASQEVFYLPVQPGTTTLESCRKAFDVIRAALNLV